ncbi:MAG: RNase adapter RapZ [Deltaproteobacteria bacterium]|nr:RNase adapter RapZ [Deltaproteobacteria bacterium]
MVPRRKKAASVIIITGLSGAGKSSALNVLEDSGYFCIDNLPVAFLPKFLELSGNFSPTIKGIALVMDLREKHFLKNFPGFYRRIKKSDIELELIFLEADDQTLIKRFSETRRKHPVKGGVAEAVARERELMSDIRQLAGTCIDTSRFTIHRFKEHIRKLVQPGAGAAALNLSLLSFGFRNGLPLEADIVMDVRFLPNPYFIPELKPMSGLDARVAGYVLGHQITTAFIESFFSLLELLLPEYIREGKSYLTVAIGCTGGRHRSVAIVEELGRRLSSQGLELALAHRDLNKT